jgi:HlyD family secretion protein
MSKTKTLVVIVLLAAAAGGFAGYKRWQAKKSALPKGIASGNGRIEAKLLDITSKEALRVGEILVDEGDLVEPRQVLVRMDLITLNAELAEAKANVAAMKERLAIAQASIQRWTSELELAKIEVERSRKLVEQRAGSQQEYDVRQTSVKTTAATLEQEKAKLESAKADVAVAEANEGVVQSRIADATLVSPVHGRVLYRLAEVGEVVGAGGKVLTLVNLKDVYMEIYLPAEQAARLQIGAEARIAVDFAPDRPVAGHVSFVSPEAQFTPKQVETRSERERLMFRVKIQVPEEVVVANLERVKTGVRGMGYVKVDASAVWPDWLGHVAPPPAAPKEGQARP